MKSERKLIILGSNNSKEMTVEEVITYFKPLILMCVKQWCFRYEKEDLYQFGCMEIIRLFNKYDSDRLVAFGHYLKKSLPYSYMKRDRDITKSRRKFGASGKEHVFISLQAPITDLKRSNGSNGTEVTVEESLADDFDFAEWVADKVYVNQLMECLSERHRDIIKYTFWDNLSQDQIAKKMNINQVNISRSIKRALTIMRAYAETDKVPAYRGRK
jgi:RNA polymerase sigma factor (sigma-70 family)